MAAANGHFGRDGADFPLHFPRGEGSEFLRIVQLHGIPNINFLSLTPKDSDFLCLTAGDLPKHHLALFCRNGRRAMKCFYAER